MKNCKIKFLVIVFIILSQFIISCNLLEPHDSKPQYEDKNEIYVIKIDGTDLKFIENGRTSKYLWKREKILFVDNDNIYEINLNGTNKSKITDIKGFLWEYSLSKDSEKITLILGDANYSNIYTMGSDGNNLIRITNSTTNYDLNPNISFDLQSVVFRRNWDICLMNFATLNIDYITHRTDSIYYQAPKFNFDNTKILFFEESTSSAEIQKLKIYDINNGITQQLAIIKKAVFNNTLLEITSDNKIMILDNYEFTNDSIKIIDLENNLIKNIAAAKDASFSYDEKEIIYSNGQQIHLINVDGSNDRLLYEELDEHKWIDSPKLTLDKEFIIFEKSYSILIEE